MDSPCSPYGAVHEGGPVPYVSINSFSGVVFLQVHWSVTSESFQNLSWPLNFTPIGLKLQGWYWRRLGALFYTEIMLCVDDYIIIYPISLLRSEKEITEKLQHFRILLKKLPPENYRNLRCVKQSLCVNDFHSWTILTLHQCTIIFYIDMAS